MFIIGYAWIDDAVRSTEFCCDLPACKGACCCLEGARGAPLEDLEVAEVKAAYPHVKLYLPARSIAAIEERGLVEGRAGDYATRCVDDSECVFVYFENGVAKCAFERAYREGKTTWPKPISCHLFPIRVRSFGDEFLRYEEFPECAGGRKRGTTEGTKLYDFLKDSLIRKYGDAWYTQLTQYCASQER
jgi:hypothetical protein